MAALPPPLTAAPPTAPGTPCRRLMHPVYSKEYVESVRPSHRPPVKLHEKVRGGAVRRERLVGMAMPLPSSPARGSIWLVLQRGTTSQQRHHPALCACRWATTACRRAAPSSTSSPGERQKGAGVMVSPSTWPAAVQTGGREPGRGWRGQSMHSVERALAAAAQGSGSGSHAAASATSNGSPPSSETLPHLLPSPALPCSPAGTLLRWTSASGWRASSTWRPWPACPAWWQVGAAATAASARLQQWELPLIE